MSFRGRLRPFLACAVLLASLAGSSLSQQAEPAADPVVEQNLKRAQEAMAAGKYEDAIKAFSSANKRRQDRCDVCYLGMASAYLAQGDADHTLENSDRALACATDDQVRAKAHYRKGQVLLALALQDAKKLKPAEDELRAAAHLDREVAVYHLDLGIALLRQSREDEGLREIQGYLALEPQGPYERLARKLLENPKRARGSIAPDFRLTTLQGQTLNLDQLAGKVIVLDFWATWCTPCVESVGDLREVTKKFSPEQLILISVNEDSPENVWRAFVAKKRMDWPQYRDADGGIGESFGVHAFPTYIVIDGDGVILRRIVGENPKQTVVYRLKDTLAALPQLHSGGQSKAK